MGKVPAPGEVPAINIAPESLLLAGQASGFLPVCRPRSAPSTFLPE